jgi:hypothetical protein
MPVMTEVQANARRAALTAAYPGKNGLHFPEK